jgi:hypothetical protein
MSDNFRSTYLDTSPTDMMFIALSDRPTCLFKSLDYQFLFCLSFLVHSRTANVYAGSSGPTSAFILRNSAETQIYYLKQQRNQ